ncbi:MAG: protein kinase domain-containing protein [Nannocystales bacterium]
MAKDRERGGLGSADGVSPPTRLGRYTLLDRIGRGGFGVVYRALDPVLAREVATKLLRSRKGADGLRDADALIHEARMTAQLQHPHVVRIFDVGRIEGDASAYGADVFIVMELLDGKPLNQWLRHQARDAREIVEVFLQAADGLAAAHQHGIVHCDVKPANVFVTHDGQAKVLDFGLSRHTSLRTRTMTQTDRPAMESGAHRIVVGTKLYMAPEAHEGGELDAAADQYSFALALIEALAGEIPFSRQGRGILVGEKLQGISASWLKARGVPRELGSILLRATSPDPTHRYPGMDSLAGELRGWLSPRSLWRWGAVAGLTVVALGAAMSAAADAEPCELQPTAASRRWSESRAVVAARWPQGDPTGGHERFSGEIDTFVAQWTESAEAVCSADESPVVGLDHAQTCLRERLGRLDAVLSIVEAADDRVLLRIPELVTQFVPPSYCLDPSRAHELPPTPKSVRDQKTVAGVRDLLSRARANHAAGTYAEGLRLAKRGLVGANSVGFEPAQAEAMYEVGVLTVASGDLAGGAEYIEQAYLKAEARKQDRLAAAAAVRLVSIHGRYLMQGERARAWARRSSIALERLADKTKFRAALEYNLGLLEHAGGSLDLARDHFQRALSLYEKRGDERDARTCRMSLGVIEEMKGESETALALFREAYSDARTSLGLHHPDTATALTTVAGAQSSLGQLLVARENFETALDVFEQTFGPEHDTVAATLTNVGAVEFELAHYDKALVHHERALEIYEALLPMGHPRAATAVENIAAAHARMGSFEKAREGHARALEMKRLHLDPTSPMLAHAHANLGLALANLGRHEESLQEFDTAWGILRVATTNADRASVLFLRAKARKLAGVRPLDDIRRAIAGFEEGRAKSDLAEAKFELAQLLLEDDRTEAVDAARESLALFRSMGADLRAAPVRDWLSAHDSI